MRNNQEKIIKDGVKNFKSQNGNVNYGMKELIQSLHSKIDALDKKIDEQSDRNHKRLADQLNHCSGRFVSKGTFWGVSSGLLSIISGIGVWIIWMFGNK